MGIQIIPYRGQIMEPGQISRTIPNDSSTGEPSSGDAFPYTGPSVTSGPGLSSLPLPGTRALPSPPPTSTARQFRTSSMLQGSLIRQVQPSYPPMARTAHVQGSVVLAALISSDGTIRNLRLISGHPMLAPAAIDAVSQWRYRPYILNGEAIEVETQITVNFKLGEN
ncbi:MAG TPA: energy transducer TonB [Candidatus Sulfotelmatobacter sp.]|nr:energy transducer TonB [Candidatus Sulfotelmatobacter sp.]